VQPGSPPEAADAERALIGAILVQSNVYGSLDLTPQEFFNSAHIAAYEAIGALAARRHPIEPVAVADQLQAQGDAGRFAGVEGGAGSYLLRLSMDAPVQAIANAKFYAAKIRRASQLRKLIALFAGLQSRAYLDGVEPGDLIGDARREMAELELAGDNAGPVRVGDKIGDVLADIGDRAGNPDRHSVLTGISAFDDDIGGLRPERLVVVAARPGIGKTAFAGTVARNAAKRGVPALVFSLEMSFAEMTERFIGAEARVDVNALGRGRVTLDEWRRINGGSLRRLTDSPLYVDDRPQTMNRIASVSRVWRAQHSNGMALIVIDYLGLVRPQGRNESRTLEVGRMTWQAKMLAKELKVPVMLVSQLNRAVEDGAPPRLENLRDSGEIEQHADVVIFPHRTGNLAESGPADIVVAKYRGGKMGMVPCQWVGEYTTFEDGTNDGRFE
jgi:replicative DNA helicase